MDRYPATLDACTTCVSVWAAPVRCVYLRLYILTCQLPVDEGLDYPDSCGKSKKKLVI